MRIHIKGVALLAAVSLLLLGIANWASPVLHEAMGSEGAIQATSSPGPDPGSVDAEADLPLSSDEIADLQAILESINYDVGGSDGIMGPKTKAAITQVKLDLKLAAGTTDRKLLERLTVLTADN